MSQVYFYYANIIDYFRFILLGFALFNYDKPILFFFLYGSSSLMDLFDGMAARHWGQFSRFGSALDMIADRLSTASLLIILGSLYKNWTLIFLLLVLLDVGSHWLQIYSSLLEIIRNPDIVNHKSVKEKFIVLEIYYKNKYVLFTLCLFGELFLLLTYLNFFHPELMINEIYKILFYVSLVLYSIKQFTSIVQIFGAADRIVSIDEKELEDKRKIK